MRFAIESGLCGRVPVHHRRGTGVPLLLFHARRAEMGQDWLTAAQLGDRPVAMIGTAEMMDFATPPRQIVRYLLALAGWRDAPRIDVFGASAGGFPALLFGALLSLARPQAPVSVLAISPLVGVWPVRGDFRAPLHERLVAQVRRSPRRRARLARYGEAGPWIAKAAAAGEGLIGVDVLYPQLNERDGQQAALLRDLPGVRLLPLPTARHDIATVLDAAADPQRLSAWLGARLGEATPAGEAARLAEALLAVRDRNHAMLDLFRAMRQVRTAELREAAPRPTALAA